MKKLFYQIIYRCIRVCDWCRVYFLLIFYWLPWGRAYIVTALRKYLESTWYSERSALFLKRRAFEMYFDHNEAWFFKRRISTKEKFGILFRPYTYIHLAQRAVYEKNLIDYI